MIIQNMTDYNFLNTRNKRTSTKLQKSLEKLSSGYKINRAADDAAGLAVSEKMRMIISGLEQGVKNIDDGINYTHSVDGASQEIHNILHRLKELAVQSANGTYDDEVDRAASNEEYRRLIDEITQITDTSDYNGIPLFEQHMPSYGAVEGSVIHNKPVTIDGDNDTLIIGTSSNGSTDEAVIKIPHGTYPADELADIIDTQLYSDYPDLIIGFNEDRCFTMQNENGQLEYISGSAAELFYDITVGSAEGYLLGVTAFLSDTARLTVRDGFNNQMNFRLGTDDTLYSVNLTPGAYTHSELISHMNDCFEAAGIADRVQAVPEVNEDGNKIIGLASKEAVTGLSGNFIKIGDDKSPIYDICAHAQNNNTPAVLTGKRALTNGVEIERDRNDYFTLSVYDYDTGADKKIKITLLDDSENTRTYTASEIIDRINEQLEAADIPALAELSSSNTIQITSEHFGNKCKVDLIESEAPSAFMVYDLFDSGNLNRVTPSPSQSAFTPASLTAQKILKAPIAIKSGEFLSFDINQNNTTRRVTVDITAGSYSSSALADELNRALDNTYPDLADKLEFTVGKTIALSAVGLDSSDIKSISAVNEGSFKKLIGGYVFNDDYNIEQGSTESMFSGTNPSTGKNNVSITAGTTTDAVRYVDETSSVAAKNGKYLVCSNAQVKYTPGKEEYESDNESEVSDLIYYPATVELKGVLSQFSTTGKSLEQLDFSLSLKDSSGTKSVNVTVPKGSTSLDAIKLIKDAFGGKVSVSSSGSDIVITSTEKGKNVSFTNAQGTLIRTASVNSLASVQGAKVDIANNTVSVPPTLTVPKASTQIPYICDDSCNLLNISACGKSYSITLENKTYNSLSEIANEINSKILALPGENAAEPSLSVKVSGNSLIFTGPYNKSGNVSINSTSTCLIGKTKISTDPSNPGYNPATGTVDTPGKLTVSGINSHFPMNVDSSNNEIIIGYASPSGNENISITIPDGTYSSPQQIADIINGAQNKVKASYTSSGLVLETVGMGAGYKITGLSGSAKLEMYKKPVSSGSSGDVSSGTISHPAVLTAKSFSTITKEPLVIDDSNDTVSIGVGGSNYEFTLNHGTYTNTTQIFLEFKRALADCGADSKVTASLQSGSLVLTTVDTGASANITVNGATTAPVFQAASNVPSPVSVRSNDVRCQIMGRNVISSMKISDFNNSFTFKYAENGASGDVTVTIPEGVYTAQKMAEEIQKSIDNSIGSGLLEVFVSGGKVGIRSNTPSDTRAFSDFEGSLFDKVFQNASYYSISRHTEKAGTSNGDTVSYIVGRNTLEPVSVNEIESGKNVCIFTGINDNVIFDFTYNGDVHEINFNLPAGAYTPEELAEAIENLGREKFAALTDENGNHFPADFFNASIGLGELGIGENQTGITSHDKLVLWCRFPDDGTKQQISAIIDGVRGNSAYRIFYDATRSPEPSVIIGKADLTDGVTITEGENDTFYFELDGIPHDLKIPAGTYTCQDMVDELNKQLTDMNSIVMVCERKGKLMFYTSLNDDFEFSKISGSAANDLFYDGTERESDTEIGIHEGRRTDSYIQYKKTRVDDHLMRINTTGITTMERALKAIDRLEGANSYLSGWRALSGANANRSEHTKSRNNVYIENLTSAESRLRDTDMATEMASFQKQQILMQTQNAIYPKVRERYSSVLNLLA